jgi:hypothetical protein
MSSKIVLSFQVTNMLIMEDTLKRLGHTFSKIVNGQFVEGLSIDRPYFHIDITKDQIVHDSMDRRDVERIMYEYQKDFQVHERTVRGELFEVTETKDEVVILVN